ncbi:MAG: hypothetical protein LBD84_01840 [Campylobacteraceae bacterium]|jgi:hypothetical protein|nr:hypothetical protein [Campylobacteraceae bacterium]
MFLMSMTNINLDQFYKYEYINKLIKNIRDLNKIIAIMSFEYSTICENVNFVDYFIPLIKIHNIDLYNSIKNNPKLYIAIDDILKENENIRKEILENFKNSNFLEYRKLLEIVFPVFSNNSHVFYQTSNIHINRPLASEIYFDNYFAFDPSPKTISMKEYMKIRDLMFSDKRDEFIENILDLDNNNKSRLFIRMFHEIDFSNLNICDDNILKGAANIFSVTTLVKETIYDKSMGLDLDFDPYNVYFESGLQLLNKIDGIFEDNHVHLSIKANILFKCQENKYGFLDNQKVKELNSKIKSEFEKLTLEKIFEIKNSMDYELLDNISAEIKEKIFSSKKWFLKILNLFKIWHRSSPGNQYLIGKEFMKIILSLDKIDNYIKTLNIEHLTKDEKELLEIWNISKQN